MERNLLMNFKTSDFPFTIMDVASLLRLHIRRSGGSYAYADCPLCGDRRGKLCLNLNKNAWYANCCGENGGMLALYARMKGVGNAEANQEIREALMLDGFPLVYEAGGTYRSAVSVPKETVDAQTARATCEVIHQTYSALLSMLSLIPAHRTHLREKRGLTDEQIDRLGYKSTPPPYLCRTLTERLIKQGCAVQGVPGFYVDDNGKWTVRFFKRTSGILIPYRGVDGTILGLQTRLDVPLRNDDDPPDKVGVKYLTLSSADKPMGTSSGSPVHFVGDPCSRVVYVTEGALKADIAHMLTNRTFAATVGTGGTAGLRELFAFLHRNGTEEIIEAEDMDKYSKPGVQKGASQIYLLAKEFGMSCKRLTWNPNYKGIDDWQLALHRKEKQKKEAQEMRFKERYLSGECTLDDIDLFTARWHNGEGTDLELHEYLGLTDQEYAVFLQQDLSTTFRALMDSQRKLQRYRIYQLELSDSQAHPFAFGGMEALHKAGYQQPPAKEYQLVYDDALPCPQTQSEGEILKRIFDRFNDSFPTGYHGRSVSPSDVIELYDKTERRYFYCDLAKFVPVQFSPFLAKKLHKSDA